LSSCSFAPSAENVQTRVTPLGLREDDRLLIPGVRLF